MSGKSSTPNCDAPRTLTESPDLRAPDLRAPDLLTIGYEGCTIRDVLDALAAAGVGLLIDVRAVPRSRKPGFSKRQLAAGLDERGIPYVHLQCLGTPKSGRDAVRAHHPEIMRTIFQNHMTSDQAQAELGRAKLLARKTLACLLCFEHDPACCHRTIVADMIAADTGQQVVHLFASEQHIAPPRHIPDTRSEK